VPVDGRFGKYVVALEGTVLDELGINTAIAAVVDVLILSVKI